MEYRIDADLIITGVGETIDDGSILVKEDKIKFVGGQEHAPEVSQTFQTPVLMPGMWDCHGHYTGYNLPKLEESLTTMPQVAALRASWDVRETVQSGFTSVREVGGQGIYLNKVIQEGLITGPRIYSAGNVIGTTGGHSDLHNTPLEVIRTLKSGQMPFLGEVADGRAECFKAVRSQIRKGAEIIKYCASGGVMSEIDHPIHQQFSLDEQEAIIEEASRANLAVAAHCHGAPGIKSALDAGVTTIEHGTYLDEDLADLMIEKNAILVPTRYVIEKLLTKGEEMGVPEYAMAKVKEIGDQHAEAVRIAIKKGVKIALGTDIFVSGPDNIFRWGDNAQELVYLTDLGLSPKEAIIAATSMGPKTLGKRAPKSGEIATGYHADLIFLKENPLEDVSVLTDRSNILQIVKNGKRI